MDTPTTLVLSVMVPEPEAEDHTEDVDLSSVHCGAVEESSEPPEGVSKAAKNYSQTGKDDFEAVAKEFEQVMDQEDIGDHHETNGIKGDDDFDSEASAKKSEDQKDIIETKEVSRDEGHDDFAASAKGLGDNEEIGDHLKTTKQGKGDDSSDDGNTLNQSPDLYSFSIANHDDIEAENCTDPSLGDGTTEKYAPVHLGSVAELEESSNIKNTNRQSEDDVLPSKSLESDLNMLPLSSQDKEACNGNTELDKPAVDPVESLSSQDDSHEEKEVVPNSSTEADQDRMSSDAENPISDGVLESIESQERYYGEIAPIKCTFVGRTIKTVVRTSTEVNNDATVTANQRDNYTSSVQKIHHSNTAASKESLTLPNGDSAKKAESLESGYLSLKNGRFLTSNSDLMLSNQDLQKNTQVSIESDVLPKQEQKFPYKYETVI